MNLHRKDAIALLKALNYQTVEGWTEARLTARIRTLDEVADATSLEGHHLQGGLRKLLLCIKAGVAVGVIPDPEGKPFRSKQRRARHDALGYRAASSASKINACLTTAPTTIAEVCEMTGLSYGRVAQHLKALHDRDLVIKTPVTYRLHEDTETTVS